MSNLEYYLLEKEGENSKCGILDLGKCMDSDENSTGETVYTTSTNVEVPSTFTDNGNCHEEEIRKDGSISATDLKLGEQTQVVETSGDQILRFISTEESCPDEVSEDRDMEVEKDMGTCESADSVLKDIIDMNVGVGINEDSQPSVDGNSEIADTNGERDELTETLPGMGNTSPHTNTNEKSTKANIKNEIADSDSKSKTINDIIDDFCNESTEILTTKESSFSESSDTDDKGLPVVDESNLEVEDSDTADKELPVVDESNLEVEDSDTFDKGLPVVDESNLEVEDGEMDVENGMELEAKKIDLEENTKESKEKESEAMEQHMEVEEREMETEEKNIDDKEVEEREMETVEQDADDKEVEEREMETVEDDADDKEVEEREMETLKDADDKEVEEKEMEMLEEDADDKEVEEREMETLKEADDNEVEEREMETGEQDADDKEVHAVDVEKDLEGRKEDSESKEVNVKDKDGDLEEKEKNVQDKDINLQDSLEDKREKIKDKPEDFAYEEEDSEDLDDNLEEIIEDEDEHSDSKNLEDKEEDSEDLDNNLEEVLEDDEHSDGKTLEDKEEDSEDLDNNVEEILEDEHADGKNLKDKEEDSEDLDNNLEEILEDEEHSDDKNLENKEEQLIDNEEIENTVIEDNTDTQSYEEPEEKSSNELENAEDTETSTDKSENIDMEHQDQEANKLSEKTSKEKTTLIYVKESVEKEKNTNKGSHLKESELLSTEQEEIFERSNAKSVGKVNKPKQQKPEKTADVSAHTSTAIVNNAKDHIMLKGVQENMNDPYIDFDEESIENISKTIKSFSSENIAFKKHEKRTGSNQKTDSTQSKRVIMVKTASNVERVKRKLEEILDKSKGEEDAAIAELQRMKKEKTDILNAITTEMEKLKSMLVKEKQG